MRTLTILAVLAATALAPAAFAQKPDIAGAVGTAPGQAKAVAIVSASATITAIDPATRTLHLKTSGGETRSIEVGDEVRNFDQLKVGDKVKAKYMESLTIELRKDGKAVVGRTEASNMQRAQPGQKPGGTAIHELTVVADVVAVDEKKKTVSVKDENGEIVHLDVRDPQQLALVKKGDKIEATYSVALAISVEPAAPAQK
jgi:hypothetical protein